MNLTAAQLDALQKWMAGHPGEGQQYNDGQGNYFSPTYSGGNMQTGDPGQLVGYSGVHRSPGGGIAHSQVGERYQMYNPTGNQAGEGVTKAPDGLDKFGDMMPYIIAAMGTAGAAGLLGPEAAIGAGGSWGGGAGAAASSLGGANGPLLSKAALDGTTAFGANSIPGAYELGAGGVASGAGGPNFSQGFTDGGTAGGAVADTTYAGNVGAGVGPASVLSNAASPTTLSSLAKTAFGSAPSWLAPALGAVGGLLGSKGSQQSVDTTKKMDPRLDGAVFGANGLVPQAQGLLAQQMSPEGQAGWKNMQNVGQGLLNQPMAGNGYQMFAGRKL